jgi:hypothetical protein
VRLGLTHPALVSVAAGLARSDPGACGLLRVEEGSLEPERVEDFAAREFGQRRLADALGEQPERDEAEVAVDDARARLAF